MSYILDALRRAEAERARGGVPGLHAQQPSAGVSVAADDGGRRWPLPALLIAGALLALAGALAALWWRGAASPPVAAGAAPAPPVALNPAPAAAAAPAASAAPTGPLVVVMTAPAAPLAAPATAVQAPRPAAATPAPVPAPAATAASVPAAQPAANANATPARPLTLAELPEPAQRELAALSLGGAVYADQPAARLVIINGQVFHEGDRPTPALQIEQIGLKALVVKLRGQRVTLPL